MVQISVSSLWPADNEPHRPMVFNHKSSNGQIAAIEVMFLKKSIMKGLIASGADVEQIHASLKKNGVQSEKAREESHKMKRSQESLKMGEAIYIFIIIICSKIK